MSEPTTNPRPDHHHPAARRPGTAGLTDTTADNRDADRHEATSTPASPARRDGQGGTGRPADRRRRRNGHTDSRPRSNILSDRQQGNRAAGISRPSAHRRHLHSSSRRRCVRCQRAAVTQVKAASFEKRDISRIEATRSRALGAAELATGARSAARSTPKDGSRVRWFDRSTWPLRGPSLAGRLRPRGASAAVRQASLRLDTG